MKADFYLGHGRFTEPGENVQRYLGEFKEPYITEGIHGFINVMKHDNEKFPELWRKRTAEQILEDGFIIGSTDAGILFVTFARAKGLPAVYVETVKEDCIVKPVPDPIDLHVFADVLQDRKWVPHNPGHGITKKDGVEYFWDAETVESKFTEIARGLDFLQLYTGNSLKNPTELTSRVQISRVIERFPIIG